MFIILLNAEIIDDSFPFAAFTNVVIIFCAADVIFEEPPLNDFTKLSIPALPRVISALANPFSFDVTPDILSPETVFEKSTRLFPNFSRFEPNLSISLLPAKNPATPPLFGNASANSARACPAVTDA